MPPKKKYFLNPRYDSYQKTFEGVIEWGSNTFGGDSKWEYYI
jgi:hypothetical protein